MACGHCGGRRRHELTPDSRRLLHTTPSPGDDGVYTLQTAEEPVAYSGMYRGATVFVVGYGTDSETLYVRKDRTKAIQHARKTNLTFSQFPARAMPHDAMVNLFGA